MWKWKSSSVQIFVQRLAPSRAARGAGASLLLAAAAVLPSCNQAAYVSSALCTVQTGPGFYSISPKLDLALVEDNTGSMDRALDKLKEQTPGFLQLLEAQGWDYRFATIPLTARSGTTGQPVTQVMAAKADGNWNARNQWIPPFPGASPYNPTPVAQSLFRFPDQYTGFLGQADVNTSVGGSELGFKNVYESLNASRGDNYFLRPDSLLAVLVVGNGDDTTDYVDASSFPGEHHYDANASRASSAQWLTNFRSLRSNPSQFKFYAHVSPGNVSRCALLSSASKDIPAEHGERYIRMAQDSGGQAYDVCNVAIGSALADLSRQLQVTKVAYRTRFVIVSDSEHAVDGSSIAEVRKNSGCGDKTGTVIPQSSTNGWTFAGLINNQYAITSPIQANPVSGYAIELHGNAMLSGTESLQIVYKGAGVKDSATTQ